MHWVSRGGIVTLLVGAAFAVMAVFAVTLKRLAT